MAGFFCGLTSPRPLSGPVVRWTDGVGTYQGEKGVKQNKLQLGKSVSVRSGLFHWPRVWLRNSKIQGHWKTYPFPVPQATYRPTELQRVVGTYCNSPCWKHTICSCSNLDQPLHFLGNLCLLEEIPRGRKVGPAGSGLPKGLFPAPSGTALWEGRPKEDDKPVLAGSDSTT